MNDEPTGGDLVDEWAKRVHPSPSICPGCGENVSSVGLTKLAYRFEQCSCDVADYEHLAERVWHLACLADKAADFAAIEQLRSASYVLLGTKPDVRRNVKADIDILIGRLGSKASLPQKAMEDGQ
jgi:hypothetical protein